MMPNVLHHVLAHNALLRQHLHASDTVAQWPGVPAITHEVILRDHDMQWIDTPINLHALAIAMPSLCLLGIKIATIPCSHMSRVATQST
jgi:hypothetical protein